MRTKSVRMMLGLLLMGCILLALMLPTAPRPVFAADPYFFIFTSGDTVVCTEPSPGVGNITFNVTANYSLLPSPTAGTQGFLRTRKVDGVAYAVDSTGFTVYGAGVYMSGTSHPPYPIPPGATSYTFTLEELLSVNNVQTSITSITVRCDAAPGAPNQWVGSFVSVTGDPNLDAANTGTGVPNNPANAGGHSNSHACDDNPGKANDHRPDNVPPCR